MLEHFVHTLYAYTRWANERLLDTALQLSPQALIAKPTMAADSIRDTLVHIMSAEQFWLIRWQAITPDFSTDDLDVPNIATIRYWILTWNGLVPMVGPNPTDFPDIPSIRTCWQAIEHQTAAFVRRQDDATLARVVEYVNVHGVADPYPRWQMMVQQANHATHHRSEVALQLTELGHAPPSLEFISYIDTHPQECEQ